MRRRPPKSSVDICETLRQIVTAIPDEPNWPASAPTAADYQLLTDEIETAYQEIRSTAAQLRVMRSNLRKKHADALDKIQKADLVTDFLYGARSPRKIVFGLKPKGKPGERLARLTNFRIERGIQDWSLKVDWEAIDGASYEIQWYLDPGLKEFVGSAVSTQSEYEIPNLVAGTQYWIRVRPVRGSKTAPWAGPYGRIVS